MNVVLLLSVTIGLFSCQCLCFNVRTTALIPRGFRACIASERGLESFAFYAYVVDRRTTRREPRKRFEGTVTSATDGLWCYTNRQISLRVNDEIVYWYRVVQFGIQSQVDSVTKKLQATDFVDESGHYISSLTRSTSTTESTDTLQSQEYIFAATTEQVAQEEEFDHPIETVTPRRGLQKFMPPQPTPIRNLMTTERQIAPAHFNAPQISPAGVTLINAGHGHNHGVKLETGQHPEPEQHPIRISENQNYGQTDQQIMSSSDMDMVTTQPTDGEVLTKEVIGNTDYTANTDSININIVINRKPTPCDTSDLFNLLKTGIEEDISPSQKNKSKSCESLLLHEKKFSEAARISYQECTVKANGIENDLLDAKKQTRIINALLKQALEMVNYLKVNSTNKLVLKSLIPLPDYKQMLREIFHALLDIKSSQYNIVQSDLQGDRIVNFEVGNYNEKLLLLLNGRINLAGSNYEIIDYDANAHLQKQAE